MVDGNTKLRGEFFEALGKLQAEMKKATRSTEAYNYKYTPLDDCQEIYQPALAKHGFCLFQTIEYNADLDRQMVWSVLGYKNGYSIEGHALINPPDPTNPQKVGSYITYMRRYAACAMVGLKIADDDDDGAINATTKPQSRSAPRKPPSTKDQEKLCTPKQAQAVRVMLSKFYGGNTVQGDSYLMKAYSYTMDDDGKPSCKRLKWDDASNLISRLKIELEKKERTEPENENQDTGFATAEDPPF